MNSKDKAFIFDLGRFRGEDGPGIRTCIFFKGCPLRCRWCSNPFGLSKEPQLVFNKKKCVACGYCVEVCPEKAAFVNEDGSIGNDFTKCINCGKCTEKCPTAARKIVGEAKTVEELVHEVLLDAAFYRRGNGGVTLSGGEPLNQYQTAAEILRLCGEQSVHTCIETSAYAPWKHFEHVLQYTDLAFIDLKHIDSARHKEITGVTNELILKNIQSACEYMSTRGKKVIIRRPLVPGLTDDDWNTIKSAQFIAELPGNPEINLLPYHNLGEFKYEMIGKKYAEELKGTKMWGNRDEIVLHIRDLTRQYAPGNRVGVGGGDISLD